MPKVGIKRYIQLLKTIKNPLEYIVHKGQRKLRPLVFTTKPNNIDFEVPESLYQVFKEIFMSDVYHIDNLVKLLPENPIVIDIGANAGFFDILLLSRLNQATILAYEPIPSNVQMLQNTSKNNTLMSTQVKLFAKAVCGKECEGLDLFIEDTDSNQVVASIFTGFNKNNTKKITVECISLSQIINNIENDVIDLLKMDCEGSEYDIVYNTPKELFCRIHNLFIEVHNIDEHQNNIHFFNSYIKSLGYKTSYSPINNFCYAFEAIKQ